MDKNYYKSLTFSKDYFVSAPTLIFIGVMKDNIQITKVPEPLYYGQIKVRL